eukprot:GHVS01055629.1.p1 GENE.GHVS01055629.1~~GHVS01055629.1.p1  ORF type:complete len:531 (+),score=70.37 GHVS01055629.1:63-1595(+)
MDQTMANHDGEEESKSFDIPIFPNSSETTATVTPSPSPPEEFSSSTSSPLIHLSSPILFSHATFQSPSFPPLPMSIASGSNTPPREHSNTFRTRQHSPTNDLSRYLVEKPTSPLSPVSTDNSSFHQGGGGGGGGGGMDSSKGQRSTTADPFTPTSAYSSPIPPSGNQSIAPRANHSLVSSSFFSNQADHRPLLFADRHEVASPCTSAYKQPLWIGGMFLSAALCPLFNVCAMEFLPASVVGFAGVQIIFVMILARTWLHEDISIWNFFGAILVIAGLFLLSFFSGRDPVFNTLDDFWGYLSTLQAILFFSITGGITLFGICYYGDRGVAWVGGSFCGLCRWCTHFQRVMLPSTAGLFGGFAVLSAKAMMMAITSIMTEPHNSLSKIASQWKAVFIILTTAAFALAELVFINKSLQKYQAFSVVPIVNSVITLSGAVGGILIFQEYPSNPILWSVGLVMILAGVLALSYARRLYQLIRSLSASRSSRVSSTFGGPILLDDGTSPITSLLVS